MVGRDGARPQIPIDSAGEGSLVARTMTTAIANTQPVVADLSAAEVTALHARLEPLPHIDQSGAPTMRAPSPPPPRPGAVVPIAFAAPTGKPVADAPIPPAALAPRPLPPPQVSPDGDVRAESEVRVRFSEPMVAISEVDRATKPAATIAPSVAGKWRWIDSRVAVFMTDAARFAGATEYTVTVPRDTRSLTNAVLADNATTKFTTPPISLTAAFPTVKLRPESPLLIQFDQAFDPTKIVAYLSITDTGGRARYPFEVITLADARARWAANPSVVWNGAVEQKFASNSLVLAPKGRWPVGGDLRVVLAKGAPSAEGPRPTTRETTLAFEIAPEFRVAGIVCGDLLEPRPSPTCPANESLQVEFSSAILTTSFRAEKVQLRGLPFEDHRAVGNSVAITSPGKVGRSYLIDVTGELIDVYGQPLGGPRAWSFRTGAERWQSGLFAQSGVVVLDPRFEIPQWVVEAHATPTLHVALYRVEPSDFFNYLAFQGGRRAVPPGRRVYDHTHQVGLDSGAIARVDLRPALSAAGHGHVIAVAEVNNPRVGDPRVTAWIQVTKLAVSARVDSEQVSAWANDISPTASFLAPIADAETKLLVDGRPPTGGGKTDRDGHSSFDLMPAESTSTPRRDAVLVVKRGDDSAFVAIDRYTKAIRHHDALWYVTDDRFTYKPGETVYFKGWVRWTHDGPNPDLAEPSPNDNLSYSLTDSRGVKLAAGTTRFSDQGGFHLELALPPNANLGTANLLLTTRGKSHAHAIAIQEFRRPAFAVALEDDVTHRGATPLVLGEAIEMQATAKYYAGGGLEGARLAWQARLKPTSYRPPGYDHYSFEVPVARSMGRYRSGTATTVTADQVASLGGDSSGSAVFGASSLYQGRPAVLEVDATVTDVDRMAIRASSRPIIIHPSNYYVGLRLAPNSRDALEAIVTNVDGDVVPNVAIDIELEGVLPSERMRDDAKLVVSHRCTLTSSRQPASCSWARDDRYVYRAIARVVDQRGRRTASSLDIPYVGIDDKVELAASLDKDNYRPGDTAKLTIRSLTTPATAVVTVARNGIVSQRRVALANQSTVVELPIEPSFTSNVYVDIDRYTYRRPPPNVTQGVRDRLPDAHHLQITIPIDRDTSRLVMRTRPLKKLVEPGEQATFEVEVAHGGAPVAGAEVALIVVDEAILALSSRNHQDPLEPFYRAFGDLTDHVSSIDLVEDLAHQLEGQPGFERFKLSDVHVGTVGHGSGYGSGGGGAALYGRMGTATSVVAARKDFRPTAVFSPLLTTDASGKVRLTVAMPDSLTRYRVIALAAARDRLFGKAESAIVAQRKVTARTIAPRFLNQGDRFSLPIVIQNLDSVTRTIDVAVRADNLTAVGPSGRRVSVPAGQRSELRFDFTTVARGTATIQTIASSGTLADASQLTVPVYEPATTETFATYGTTEALAYEQLAVPAAIFPDVGGVEVELASTQLQSITDALWYLHAYPYECAEQRSSRMLATAAVGDILAAFERPGKPSAKEIAAQASKDRAALEKEQKSDGGWGYFMGTKSDPFVTQQVLTALAASKIGGSVVSRARNYVGKLVDELFAKLEREVAAPLVRRQPSELARYDVALAAAALSAIAATGTNVAPRAARLDGLARELGYPVDAKARVLAQLARSPNYGEQRTRLVRELVSATHETTAAATVTVDFMPAERLLLVSNTKTTALTLAALLREAPDHPLIPKLARGVLDGRALGRWRTTQENLVALQALRSYFDVFEKQTPNFTGRLWFGSAFAERTFAGRTSERAITQLTWHALTPGTNHDLAIAKEGSGRLYYRVAITYAPKRVDLPALDAGFIVRRHYTAVDDPSDVVTTADGVRIRLGARVLVRLQVINSARRLAVAVVDPLPAGLEPVNSALAVAERASDGATTRGWDHVNTRNERVEAFAMDLREGEHEFSFTARATTPGVFAAAPAKAEEMYDPATFGRSAGVKVVVE